MYTYSGIINNSNRFIWRYYFGNILEFSEVPGCYIAIVIFSPGRVQTVQE